METRLTTSAFDGVADRYDAEFTDTAVGRALRRIVWSRLAGVFRPSQRILELGCGTGEDAIRLAKAGMNVVATDASPAMIDVAREKARRSGCLERIEFQCVPMEEVGRVIQGPALRWRFFEFRRGQLRARPVVAGDRPGEPAAANGALVWVIMGKRVPWEWLWYLLRADRRRAFRRYRPGGMEWRGLTGPLSDARRSDRASHTPFHCNRVSSIGGRATAKLRGGLVESFAAGPVGIDPARGARAPVDGPRLVVRPLHTGSPSIGYADH